MAENQETATATATSSPAEVKENKYDLSLEAMLKAGMHFGHKKSRWNPRMNSYIFGIRNGVHIIDLEKSLKLFQKALGEIEKTIEKGQSIMLVGTKRQVKDLVRAIAEKAEIAYVNERWVGGTLTNFPVIKKRIKYYLDSQETLKKGRLSGLTKLERTKLAKELERIEEKMGGLIDLKELPGLIIVLDINKDELAVKEAQKMGIPVVGLVDSNSDPKAVEFPIPANDDALSSLRYICGVFLKKILEAKRKNKA
jgi:small subunit ribosomal protein S2